MGSGLGDAAGLLLSILIILADEQQIQPSQESDPAAIQDFRLVHLA